MVRRVQRASLLHDLTTTNPWWTDPSWEIRDPHLRAAQAAPFEWQPGVLSDVAPPNLYTLRGPRRVGKTTVVKQTIARLVRSGVDPRRICFFAADALADYRDLINLFQAARLLFPDLGDVPRYFFVDEVTAVAEWQRGVKWVRDNTLAADDCIVATGSSAGDVAGGTTYLAGRRGPAVGLDRLLLPMPFPDFVRCAGFDLPAPPRLPYEAFHTPEGRRTCQDALAHVGRLVDAFEIYIQVGGFPQAVLDYRRAARLSDGFLRDLWDVVQADLGALGVSRPEQTLRLLAGIVARVSSTMVLRGLAEELGVSHPTAGSWLDALANAYAVLFLFQEEGGVPDLRRQRKVYPIDPALAALPSRLSAEARPPELSQLAEAVLATDLSRAVEGQAIDELAHPSHLFFYRSDRGGEVDFVVFPGPLAAESKYVDVPAVGEARALLAKYGAGIMLTRSAFELSDRLAILPAGLFAWLLAQSR